MFAQVKSKNAYSAQGSGKTSYAYVHRPSIRITRNGERLELEFTGSDEDMYGSGERGGEVRFVEKEAVVLLSLDDLCEALRAVAIEGVHLIPEAQALRRTIYRLADTARARRRA